MRIDTEPRRFGWRLVVVTVAVLALDVLLTFPFLGSSFLGDDWHYVYYSTRNGLDYALQAWTVSISPEIVLYRPLSILSFCLDAAIWGAQPVGWHITNLVLHSINVVLLATLAWRRGLSASAVFIGTAVFCLHPIAAESVFWISARMDSLTTLWLLLGLHLLQDRMPLDAWSWTGLLALAIAAACTKELGLAVPFVWSASHGFTRSRREGILLLLAAIVLTVTAIGLRVGWFGSVGGYPISGGWSVHALSFCRNAFGLVLAPYALKIPLLALDDASRLALEAVAGYGIWSLLILHAYFARTLHLLLMLGICLLPAFGLSIDPFTLEGGRLIYMAAAIFGLNLATSWNALQPRLSAHRVFTGACTILGVAVLAFLLTRRSQAWSESSLKADSLLECIQSQWKTLGPFELLDLDAAAVQFLDSHRGAQLFRNGLPFAVALRLGRDEPVLIRRGPSALAGGFPVRLCIPGASE